MTLEKHFRFIPVAALRHNTCLQCQYSRLMAARAQVAAKDKVGARHGTERVVPSSPDRETLDIYGEGFEGKSEIIMS
eukprot:725069-Pleurochrysis_carterae.AAC.1